MQTTPNSMRKHIAIFGNTNVGKSTLFNLLLGQETAIVSDVSGTTTDPVSKPMELIPYGPVVLIDTAGLGDSSELGGERMKKTKQILSRTDLILQVTDINAECMPQKLYSGTPTIFVFTKCDIAYQQTVEETRRKYPDAIFLGDKKTEAAELERLRQAVIRELEKQERDDDTLLGNLLPRGSRVVLVIPIDSEAPKGRLILPQVQLLRDCLDYEIIPVCTRVETLGETLAAMDRVDLVVTDSQAFREVEPLVPPEIPLTSFSMLLANQKGNFAQLLAGAQKIANLRDGAKILMLEGCTHNSSHEDIGRVKIPTALRKKTGKDLEFVHVTGYDFPDNAEEFDLAIQCGMCMINRREVQSRLQVFEEKGIPISNYGVVLAYLSGILERASQIFRGRS